MLRGVEGPLVGTRWADSRWTRLRARERRFIHVNAVLGGVRMPRSAFIKAKARSMAWEDVHRGQGAFKGAGARSPGLGCIQVALVLAYLISFCTGPLQDPGISA